MIAILLMKTNGGFHHNFFDDGTPFNKDLKHLVSSTRIIYNYSKAYELFAAPKYLSNIKHGLEFIKNVHFDESRRAYHWVFEW